MCRRVIDCYHFFLNNPICSRLDFVFGEVCYWKGLVMQEELYSKPCNICQQLKKRNTLYGRLSPKKIAEIKPWYLVHVDLIFTYIKSIRQHQLGSAIVKTYVSLT